MRENSLQEGLRWLRQSQEDLHWAQYLAKEAAIIWHVFSRNK